MSAGVDPTRSRGRVSAKEELRRDRAGARESRRPSGLDRHGEGRGCPPGARARSGDGQRRHRAARGSRLAEVAAEADAYVCLMHMQGEPRTMQANPTYDDVVSDVKAFLGGPSARRGRRGIREDRICVDPGIGFGKTVDHNFELIRRLDEIAALGRPVVVGFSRKSLARTHPRRPRRNHRSALGQHRGGGDRLRAWCDDPPRARREGARGGADRGAGGGRVIVELVGLEVFGRHGGRRRARPGGRSSTTSR